MLETLNNMEEMTANGNDFLKGFLLCKILLRINSRLNLVFGPSRTSHESISRRATYYDLCSKRNHSRVANYTCLALTYLSKASESHESMRDLSFFLSPSVVILKSWFDVVAFLHPQYNTL